MKRKRKRIIACTGLLVVVGWFGWWSWCTDIYESMFPGYQPAFYFDAEGYGHCSVMEG